MFWSSKFESSATIFADNQNILKPLLAKQAAQSKVQNQTKVVRDKIHSPRILKKVIENIHGLDSFESAEDLGKKINRLRGKLVVKGIGANYIKVTYSDSDSALAYKTINNVIDIFVKSSSDEQRSESREAFLFIDNQVKQYKEQLVSAEEKLKDFKSFNFDGQGNDVDASLSRIRSQVQELKISLDENRITIKSLKKQLANEPEFSSQKYTADVYGDRLLELESLKSTLLLSYTDDYPDVVSITYQIDDIKKSIREAAKNERKDKVEQKQLTGTEDDAILNPLYQELRSRLSLVQTELKAKEKRLVAFEELTGKEFGRRKRIAERGAEESELTRDYNVTKRIYEDMLERKERARLSMALNIEGQGVTYRIQEPALPPLNPVGLRFLHFVAAGPFVGLLSTLAFIILFVLLDRRIRFSEEVSHFGVPVLAVIPHIKTSFTKRVVRMDIALCLIFGLVIMSGYISLAYASKMGLI